MKVYDCRAKIFNNKRENVIGCHITPFVAICQVLKIVWEIKDKTSKIDKILWFGIWREWTLQRNINARIDIKI
jgi:hypothetical protein